MLDLGTAIYRFKVTLAVLAASTLRVGLVKAMWVSGLVEKSYFCSF